MNVIPKRVELRDGLRKMQITDIDLIGKERRAIRDIDSQLDHVFVGPYLGEIDAAFHDLTPQAQRQRPRGAPMVPRQHAARRAPALRCSVGPTLGITPGPAPDPCPSVRERAGLHADTPRSADILRTFALAGPVAHIPDRQ